MMMSVIILKLREIVPVGVRIIPDDTSWRERIPVMREDNTNQKRDKIMVSPYKSAQISMIFPWRNAHLK